MTEQNQNQETPSTPPEPELPKVERLSSEQMDALVTVGEQDIPLREVVEQAQQARTLEEREALLQRAQPALQMGAKVHELIAAGRGQEAMQYVAQQAGVALPQVQPQPAGEQYAEGEGPDPTQAELAKLKVEREQMEMRLRSIESRTVQSDIQQQLDGQLDRFNLYKGDDPAAAFRRDNAKTVILAHLTSSNDASPQAIKAAAESYHTREARNLQKQEDSRAEALRKNSQVLPSLDPSRGLPELSSVEEPTVDDLKKNGGAEFKRKALAAMDALRNSRSSKLSAT